MKRITAITIAVVICHLFFSPAGAQTGSHDADSLRQRIATARAAGDLQQEAEARERLVVTFYNQLMYDSVVACVPQQRDFYLQHQMWRHYYYVWRMRLNAYIYSGRNNTALREVKTMYEDAQGRQNDYGLAMASHVMGLAYFNMHYTDEAAEAIDRSLKLLAGNPDSNPGTLLSIYGDYYEVVSAKGNYEELLGVCDGWWQALTDWGHERQMTDEQIAATTLATYCYVARARALGQLKRYDEAEQWLEKATANAKQYGEGSNAGYWHHVAAQYCELYYQQGRYEQALHYNDEAMPFILQRNVPTEINGLKEQRANILMKLGRYQEAAQLFKEVHEQSVEINLNDAKSQLSEMNALFKLDEAEMEAQQAQMETERTRTRMIVGTVALITLALIVFAVTRMRSARRLAQKNRELAQALDHAKESDRMKSSFIHNISHEIRTPLNIVTGFTQVLHSPEYELDHQQRTSMIEQIKLNTDKMTVIVNELLDLSDTESSTTALEKADETTAERLCQQAIAKSGAKSTPEVEFRLENRVPPATTLTTNSKTVVKILCNLLLNAMKFTRQGSVVLQASMAGTNVVFDVIDTGVGVRQEDQERIFNSFEKADAFSEGIGLGLSVARMLARRLGGDVVLSSTGPGGSRFTVTIPTA